MVVVALELELNSFSTMVMELLMMDTPGITSILLFLGPLQIAQIFTTSQVQPRFVT